MDLSNEDTKFLSGILLEYLVTLNIEIRDQKKRLEQDKVIFCYLPGVIARNEETVARTEKLWRKMLKE